MRKHIIITTFAVAILSYESSAIEITSSPIKLYTACFNNAIENNNVQKSEQYIVFTCSGQSAKVFFSRLSDFGKTTETTDSNNGNSIRKRFIGNQDYCAQVIDDDGPKYACYLFFFAGPFIDK